MRPGQEKHDEEVAAMKKEALEFSHAIVQAMDHLDELKERRRKLLSAIFLKEDQWKVLGWGRGP